MKIQEVLPTEEIIRELITLSADWEAEDSCHGYRANSPDDLEDRRIFLATESSRILGYLFGTVETASRKNSIIAEGTPFFEIEELYVIPSLRSQGIGRHLFKIVEQQMIVEGIPYLFLSTATKNYKAILHFYLDEMGMEFWNARLFKKLTDK